MLPTRVKRVATAGGTSTASLVLKGSVLMTWLYFVCVLWSPTERSDLLVNADFSMGTVRWHHFIIDNADGVIQHPDYDRERLIHMRYSEGPLGVPRGRWQLAEIPERFRNESYKDVYLTVQAEAFTHDMEGSTDVGSPFGKLSLPKHETLPRLVFRVVVEGRLKDGSSFTEIAMEWDKTEGGPDFTTKCKVIHFTQDVMVVYVFLLLEVDGRLQDPPGKELDLIIRKTGAIVRNVDLKYSFTEKWLPVRCQSNVLDFKNEVLTGGVRSFYHSPTEEHAPTDVWLCTHLRIGDVRRLKELLVVWDGYVSVAVYMSGWEPQAEDSEENEEKRRKNMDYLIDFKENYAGKKMAIHLVYPSVTGNRAVDVYPSNKLRNIAQSNAPGEYILALDAHILPVQGASIKLRDFIEGNNELGIKLAERSLYVIPTFSVKDVNRADHIPQFKEELGRLIRTNIAKPYVSPYVGMTSDGAAETNYAVWQQLQENTSPYNVKYNGHYQPYGLYKRSSVPPYDERFGSCGMDRSSHIWQLYDRQFKFLVLPNVFAVAVLPEYPSPSMMRSRRISCLQESSRMWRDWYQMITERELRNTGGIIATDFEDIEFFDNPNHDLIEERNFFYAPQAEPVYRVPMGKVLLAAGLLMLCGYLSVFSWNSARRWRLSAKTN